MSLAATLEAFRVRVANAGLETEWPRIERALEAAHRAHEGQKRRDGSPYFEHPFRVASLVLGWPNADPVAHADETCAALLHDAVEDTPLTLATVERLAGARVRELVFLLTKEDPGDGPDKIAAKAERDRVYFERLAAGDVGAAVVKCADRIDNLSDMATSGWSVAKKREYVAEARTRILPLAAGRAPRAARALEATLEQVERELRA